MILEGFSYVFLDFLISQFCSKAEHSGFYLKLTCVLGAANIRHV